MTKKTIRVTGLAFAVFVAGICYFLGMRQRPAVESSSTNLSPRTEISDTGRAVGDDNPYRLERLLDMDDVNTQAAIPQLREILTTSEDNREYAAAQALFCIGSAEARAILKKHLLSEDYDVHASIGYAFHWRMKQPERDAFITQYHLQSISKDISARLSTIQAPEARDTIQFTITLRNTSERVLRLYKPHVCLAKHILLVSPLGRVMRPVLTTKYRLAPESPEEAYPEVPPGEALVLSFKGGLKFQKGSGMEELRNSLLLDCRDWVHKLEGPGKYKVYALYYFKGPRNSPFDNIWKGRAVSKPVVVGLELPQ